MRWFGILLASLLSFNAVSAETPEFVFSGFSYHFGERQYWYNNSDPVDVNEMNIGFGVEVGDYRYVVFNNTFRKWSMAAMWVPSWELTENLSYGLRLGAAVGYAETPLHTPVLPVIGVELDYQTGNLHHIIGTEGYRTLTYHIQLEF